MAEIIVILNRDSGGGRAAEAERIAGAFAAAGARCRVQPAPGGAGLAALAARAIVEGPCALVAAGGDGTVGAVASAAAGSGVPFGVLPLGTLNHFAKDLGIPLDLESAVAAVVAGRTAAVDVCEVNGRVFVNNSSLGLYPLLVRQRELRQKLGRRKWPAFAWAAVAALRWYPFLRVRLEADGKTMLRKTPFVFIGNNAYAMQGLRIGSRDSLAEGRMCVYVTHGAGRMALVRLALTALGGRLDRARNFDSLSTAELWIDARPRRATVAVDGELAVMHMPLHYRVRPGALRVIVP